MNENTDEGNKDTRGNENFDVGDILRFVDGRDVHILHWCSACKYCHDKHVRVLHIVKNGKYDGWIELRAVSEESKRPRKGFEVRGWLDPYVEERKAHSLSRSDG